MFIPVKVTSLEHQKPQNSIKGVRLLIKDWKLSINAPNYAVLPESFAGMQHSGKQKLVWNESILYRYVFLRHSSGKATLKSRWEMFMLLSWRIFIWVSFSSCTEKWREEKQCLDNARICGKKWKVETGLKKVWCLCSFLVLFHSPECSKAGKIFLLSLVFSKMYTEFEHPLKVHSNSHDSMILWTYINNFHVAPMSNCPTVKLSSLIQFWHMTSVCGEMSLFSLQ